MNFINTSNALIKMSEIIKQLLIVLMSVAVAAELVDDDTPVCFNSLTLSIRNLISIYKSL